ncbi:hypothetical protein VLK81_01875 [Citroniella saccharovorans]|uniref:Uncharacterized protein n=1 Tax=Citroniella saccharovorans TaxID=2053367 RepID=A0AAW9MP35_9FIRM|nr:hypothetical protein [Citroniella saccharovorans]
MNLDDLKKKVSFKKSFLTIIIVWCFKLFLDLNNENFSFKNFIINTLALIISFVLSFYFVSDKSFEDLNVSRFASMVLPITLLALFLVNLII